MRVWITEIGSRRALVVRWREASGATGQETIGRLSGKRSEDRHLRREAEVRRAEIEAELADEQRQQSKPATVSWHEFRRTYRDDYLSRKSASYRRSFLSAARWLEKTVDDDLADIRLLGVRHLERLRTRLHDQISPASVDSYIHVLRSALNYAAKIGLRDQMLPADPSKKAPPKMRGRPLTAEELDRILAAVPKVIKRPHVAGWRHWITGLYLSGLRLGESLTLSWDDPDRHVPILDRIPKINFAPDQKNRRHQVVAIAPDFAKFLKATKVRAGYVFDPETSKGRIRSLTHASRRLSAIGKAAKVSTEPGRFASAHDLRRSFGCRWSLLVMPVVLQHMMRHSSIETTMKYYIHHSADLLGREILEAFDAKGVSCDVAGEVIREVIK